MYKSVEKDKHAIMFNGEPLNPVATLSDEYGARAQIAIDDHCYVLYLKRGVYYIQVYHWFREAVEVLKTLPLPE